MSPAHGLVLGKFYPPHAGHHLLVRTAARACAQVTVLALASPRESLPLDLRVAWLREVHAADRNVTVLGGMDEHPIDYDDPGVWDLHMALVNALLAAAGRPPVDAVFTSEAYGDELARRLGARHCPIDLERALAPVSATEVRRDPAGHWQHLAAPVRAHLARRVVVVGAESTGKTTLARELRDSLAARGGALAETRWVPEHGRDYTVDKLALARAEAAWRGAPAPGMADLAWPTSDFVAIARAQNALEEREARVGGPVLVCDTDALATSIWHERYRGARASEVEALGDPPPSLYLVTHHDDVPFHQDGIRDGEHIRAWMTARFVERLRGTRHRVELVRGARAARLERSLALVDAWLPDAFAQVFVDASPLAG
ncbi:MAG TPA: AAA family ATPase [Myxococcota bacterium]|nr:AAA family ATPase [Myxococcota bacterium]